MSNLLKTHVGMTLSAPPLKLTAVLFADLHFIHSISLPHCISKQILFICIFVCMLAFSDRRNVFQLLHILHGFEQAAALCCVSLVPSVAVCFMSVSLPSEDLIEFSFLCKRTPGELQFRSVLVLLHMTPFDACRSRRLNPENHTLSLIISCLLA